MKFEEEALRFVEQLQNLYFVQRNGDELFDKMQASTSWLGTGENEISRNLLEAKAALNIEFQEYGGSFEIVSQELHTTCLSDDICIVYGLLRVLPTINLAEEQVLHLSVICMKSKGEIKLAHCNVSRSDTIQIRNDYKGLCNALENHERWLKDITHNIPGGIHQCRNDSNLTIVAMSDSFLSMFGYTREEIEEDFKGEYINMVYPSDRSQMIKIIHDQLLANSTVELEYRVMSKFNGIIWVLEKSNLMKDECGNESLYCILIDITQRKIDQEQLRLSLERHKIIMDQATDIIFEWDIHADTLDFSSNWDKKFGYNPIKNSISKKIPFSKNIHPEDVSAFVKIMRDTTTGKPYSETEFRIKNIQEQYIWNRIRATTQFDDNGRAVKAVGSITDISAEKEERLYLMEQARRDALTGLYNKSAIKAAVEQRMKNESCEGMQALLIIDVDNFKQVNDVYGHLCGDTLLLDIAEALKSHFRSSDLIGRIGGDEFLIYMSMVPSGSIVACKVKQTLLALSKVRPAIGAPFITCSVGAIVLPNKEKNYINMYHAADQALYWQKSKGRNGVSFYDPSHSNKNFTTMAQSAVGDLIDSEGRSDIEQKLAQYAFQMLYQSIDVEIAVNRLLEIIGRAYRVSRVYIFESSKDGLCCNNTFEWCAPGISSEIENLQGIRYKEDLGGYLENFDQDGVFYCHDIKLLKPILYRMLEPQNIRSLLQCAVLDKGEFKGYVGFDECKENCLWNKEQIRSLTLVANVLSVFLIKLRLEEQLTK